MIDSLFKILNFILFAAIVLYYGRKKLLGMIKKQLFLRKSEHQDLMHQKNIALADRKSLQAQLAYHETTYLSLEEKVFLWKSRVNEANEEIKHHCEQYEKGLRLRRETQMAYWQTVTIGKKIIPIVIDKARQELQEFFKDRNNLANYDERTLEYLKKSD